MKYLYHCTKLKLLDKILKEGIKKHIPFQRPNKKKGVYLTKYPFNWMFNVTLGRIKGALLKIEIKDLKLESDNHTDILDKKIGSDEDFIYEGNIPKSRIKDVWIEKERNCFEELNANQ